MKINDLKLGMNEITLEAKVVEISEPRSVNTKFGYQTRVADATLEDESGQIKLSLWGKQIDEVNVGDTVKITKGYVSEFRGDVQLNVPRSGTLEVVK